MRIAIGVLCLFSVATSPALAVLITDFNSLVPGTVYHTDQVFQSDDLSFQPSDFSGTQGFRPGETFVRENTRALGSGIELQISGRLNFLLPPNTEYLSLRYYSSTANSLFINGTQTVQGTRFRNLDGMIIGGVLVDVVIPQPDTFRDRGILRLIGPLNSFAIAQAELWIDDVVVQIPEPSGAILIPLGCVLVKWRRVGRS